MSNQGIAALALFILVVGGIFLWLVIMNRRHAARQKAQKAADIKNFPVVFGFPYPDTPEKVRATYTAVNPVLVARANSVYQAYLDSRKAEKTSDGNYILVGMDKVMAETRSFEEARTLASRTGYRVKESFFQYADD